MRVLREGRRPLTDYKIDPAGFGHIDIRGDSNEIATNPGFIEPGVVIMNWCYVGPGTVIEAGTRVGNHAEFNRRCHIGRNCLFNGGVVLSDDTTVEARCIFGANSVVADERYMTARTENVIKRPVHVGKDCRIGAGAVLVACRVGDQSTVGAGSVVLRDVPPGEVWAGVPAKKIRDMTETERSL